MKRASILILLLAGGVSASATVRLLVTSSDEPYGLDNRALSCLATWSYPAGFDCDYFHVTSFPPGNHPSGSCGDAIGLVCPGSCGEPYIGGYIWLQFRTSRMG